MCRLEPGDGADEARSRVVWEGYGGEPQQNPECVNFSHKIVYFLFTKSIKSRIKGTHNSNYLR